jgi:hypothetical protein
MKESGLPDARFPGDDASRAAAAYRRDECVQQLADRLAPNKKLISDICDKFSESSLSHPAITPPDRGGPPSMFR